MKTRDTQLHNGTVNIQGPDVVSMIMVIPEEVMLEGMTTRESHQRDGTVGTHGACRLFLGLRTF